MRPEIFKTKVTRLRPGLYGCRVLFAEDDTVFAELRVPKNQIGDAFFDILRTADKLGYDDPIDGAPPAIRVGISSVLYGRDMYYDHEQVVGTPG